MRRLPFLISWLRDQHRLPQRWPQMGAATEAKRDRLRALELDGLSDHEITAHLSHSYAETERQATFAMLAQTAAFTAAQGLFWALDRWLGAEHRSLSLQLLQGVPGIRPRRATWRCTATAFHPTLPGCATTSTASSRSTVIAAPASWRLPSRAGLIDRS